jgi:hypothetical protein
MLVYNLVSLDPSDRALLDCKSPLTHVNLNVQARREHLFIGHVPVPCRILHETDVH